MVRTTFFPTLILTILCLSTMTLLPATALPNPVNLARRQALLSPTLSLPPLHRRGLDAQEPEAEAEANSKRALPRSPGGSRPGSGTYYPGQPYGRRDDVNPVNLARRQALLSPTLSLPPLHRRGLDAQEPEAEAGVVIPPTISIRDVEAEAEANSKRALPRGPGSGTYYPGQPYGRRDDVNPVNLARRQALLSPTLSLPPLHRRGLDAQEPEAEAEENSKRALPRGPGSGTYYPGQPYGRRDDVDDASS